MSSKAPPTQRDQQRRTSERGDAELVLRDESDEIIDNLKQQLQALQSQLNTYKGGRAAGAGGGSASPSADERRALDFGLTPHIASRLQVPAEELTERLERLIAQVDDPAIRAELEACRDTAFFLNETFQRIEQQHQVLTDALTADSLVMEAGEFLGRLEHALRQRGLAVPVEAVAPLPAQLRLSPQSALTMLTTLAELARDLFGGNESLTVACPRLEDTEEGADTHLQVQIAGSAPWGEAADGEAISTVAIRAGARSRAVVDLLYVEKIIEMRGGSLDFMRRNQRVYGFTMHIPITLLRKVAGAAGAT